jgi:hypothetical protein
MNPQILLLIGLGIAGIWMYSKVAAAKTAQMQSPTLTVPQGSTAAAILSSLGIATTLIPGVSSPASLAETAQYTAAANAPGSLTVGQISSGQDVGATQAQEASANNIMQLEEQAQGGFDPSSTLILSTASLQPQGSDNDDMSSLQFSSPSAGISYT